MKKKTYTNVEILSVNTSQVTSARIVAAFLAITVVLAPFALLIFWMARNNVRYQVRLTDSYGMQSVELIYVKKYKKIFAQIQALTQEAIELPK
ncbi:hypothetical protein EOK75_17285 (plasmid) [Pseudorhodobacter turbinis]|uniref:Uncharacterized protein n=1 Tax=Pseudorhodobacter turbinis TaxID=2500533 RepID=A0A4P8EK94_9RHOB|nr:hypothetical protein [Pseudorhodobacter turbinis]QCO57467.1 hypothetical protein EOK75_17285 [Pseudorhodobacter turbinis]